MAHDADLLLIALAALRLSPLFLLLLVVTTLGLSPKPPPSPSTASITNIVVADVRPRRALILTILIFAALTYLLDTVIVVVLSIVDGVRHGSTPQWCGIEVADAAGVLAFLGLAIVGSAKDKKGVVYWTRKRVKAFAFFALAFDIAYLVLLLLAVPIFPPPGFPQAPGSPSGLNVPNFLHFIALAARLLILLPLFPILLKPATTYSALQRPPPSPTHDTLLLPGAAPQPAYGTFASDAPQTSMKPGSSPATKAPDGYDVEPRHGAVPTEEAPLLARSRKSSGSSDSSKKSNKSKDFEPVAVTALTDEPEALPSTSARGAPENYPADALNTDEPATAATALETSAKEDVASNMPSEEAGSSSKPLQSTDTHGPLSFPTADDASSIRGSTRGSIRRSIRGSIRSLRTGGVNFGKDSEPRSDDAETASTKEKRKGSTSQNFQRLARRVSLVPKRQGSTSSSASAAQSAPKKDGGTGSGFLNMMKIRREESNASEASSSSSPLPTGNSEEVKKEKKKKRMSLKI